MTEESQKIYQEVLKEAGVKESPTVPIDVPKIPEVEAPKIPQEVEAVPLSCGYTVGLKATGEFVFEVLGKDTGLVQLLGIHEYASHRISTIKDISQGYGTPLLARQLKDIGETLKVILNLLTKNNVEISK